MRRLLKLVLVAGGIALACSGLAVADEHGVVTVEDLEDLVAPIQDAAERGELARRNL